MLFGSEVQRLGLSETVTVSKRKALVKQTGLPWDKLDREAFQENSPRLPADYAKVDRLDSKQESPN